MVAGLELINEGDALDQVEVWRSLLDELLVRAGEHVFRREVRMRLPDYVKGLLAQVGRKNTWQIAEYVGHVTPDGLQHLLARAVWDPEKVRDEVRDYVAEHLGAGDGVLIVDETGFIKNGIASAGVSRQYTGTSGKVDNCQVAVFAACASSLGRALVDRELYPGGRGPVGDRRVLPGGEERDRARPVRGAPLSGLVPARDPGDACARVPRGAGRGRGGKGDEGGQPMVVNLSVAEIRRLLAALSLLIPPSITHILWSAWRRRRQAVARACHYRKRGALPGQRPNTALDSAQGS